jgi:hypothetical protein
VLARPAFLERHQITQPSALTGNEERRMTELAGASGARAAPTAALAAAWDKLGRKLVKAVRRPEREPFHRLVLDLLAVAERSQPSADPRQEGLLRVGIRTAAELARHASPDPELLAAAVALPWYDAALLGTRAPLAAPWRPLDWAAAMVLAMAPANSYRSAPDNGRSEYVRQLAALPPVLRAAVILERDLAATEPGGPTGWGGTAPPLSTARPFDRSEVAALATGVPPQLLPANHRAPGAPAAPSAGYGAPGAVPAPSAGHPAPGAPSAPSAVDGQPATVDSPAAAAELVRRHAHLPFGSYRMVVDGDPGFVVEGMDLVYRVRWDVPPEAIRSLGPPLTFPGDAATTRYREPGWIVDRVTREVIPVDLSTPTVESYVAARRVYPLPPGWRPDDRPPVPDGIGADLAALLSTVEYGQALGPGLEPVVREVTARYATALSTEAWPDYLVAWQVGRETVRVLLAAGMADPDLILGALLVARGAGSADTLVDDASALWGTPAGENARVARPYEDTDPVGAVRRAARLAGAPAPVRTLALANARARYQVESSLFGHPPAGRAAELAALSPLAGDLPAIQPIIAVG